MCKVCPCTKGDGYSSDGWLIHCPACNRNHFIPKDGRWTFNGNQFKPTFTPSVNESCNAPGPKQHPRIPYSCCHYIITDGMIQFCTDCTHALAGQSLELPDVVLRD